MSPRCKLKYANEQSLIACSVGMYIIKIQRFTLRLLPIANAAILADDTTRAASVLTALQSQVTRLRSE